MTGVAIPTFQPRVLETPFSDGYNMVALGQDNRIAFRNRVVDFIAAGERDFVLDLREARYIDSTGLGVLVSVANKVREVDGSFVLLEPNEDLRTLLHLTKLDTILTVRTTEEWIRLGGTL